MDLDKLKLSVKNRFMKWSEWTAKKVAGGLVPEVGAGDSGKVLGVGSGGNPEWVEQSGSSLPSYTSSDVGKVLTVGQGTQTVTVVPEQRTTFYEDGVNTVSGSLNGVDFSMLTDGQTVTVLVKLITDTDYSELEFTYSSSNNRLEGSLIAPGPVTLPTYISTTHIWIQHEMASALDGVQMDVSASVPSVAPKWENGGGLTFYDFADFPARTETVDGYTYNSGTDILHLSLYGNLLSVDLSPGYYAFVSDLRAVADYFGVKIESLNRRLLYIPFRFDEAQTDALETYAESGFYVSSESNAIVATAGERQPVYFAFIDSSATLGHGADDT